MKLLLLVAAVLGCALPARAQTSGAPLMRADAAGTIGWLNGRKEEIPGQISGHWYNHGLNLGASAGWYWSEHHKTEIEAGGTNGISFRVYGTPLVDGFLAVTTSAFTVTLRRVAVGEQYQFRHNVWLHPYRWGGARPRLGARART